MRLAVVALLLLLSAFVALPASADDTVVADRGQPAADRAQPAAVVVAMPVVRAAAHRPRVAITLNRAVLTPPLPSGERVGVRGTFVDRITRSVMNGERF